MVPYFNQGPKIADFDDYEQSSALQIDRCQDYGAVYGKFWNGIFLILKLSIKKIFLNAYFFADDENLWFLLHDVVIYAID